ncbi:alpha/beta fold hydrolase [Streptomyces sp. P6-2-1]|uniref:alpha/beta fold hydrolase n=1 Tax=Streptomyces sp. P6-2-1 TaxID=3422591 RepID=UPI003D36E6FB
MPCISYDESPRLWITSAARLAEARTVWVMDLRTSSRRTSRRSGGLPRGPGAGPRAVRAPFRIGAVLATVLLLLASASLPGLAPPAAAASGGGALRAGSEGVHRAESGGVHRMDAFRRMPDGTRIDTSYFTAGDPQTKRPAVLLAHGFGGSKTELRSQAESYARQGYAVLTWSARGFGRSGGEIGLNDPAHEVEDVSRLVDWLAGRPEVLLDKKGDPRVGATGASYGGAISLLAAGHDPRIDAIAPEITYWDLAQALFPDGVFKKLWAGIFFTSGSADIGSRVAGVGVGCGRFTPELCAMYRRVAERGAPDAAATKLLHDRSPAAVGDRVKVPALVIQGQSDSLFPLAQADETAKHIRANGAPVAVDWIAGGHDGGDMEIPRLTRRITTWFDRYLKKDRSVDTGPAFRISRTGSVGATDDTARLTGAGLSSYPGLTGGVPGRTGASGPAAAPGSGDSRVRYTEHRYALPRERQVFANPPGGSPPSLSAVPGLGDGLAQLAERTGQGFAVDFPGQFARFDTKPLAKAVRVTGSPTVPVEVRSSTGTAVLFAKVYDVSADGKKQVLPAQLVSPVRVTGAREGRTVTVTLPAVDHQVAQGHRLRLVLSATDLGYASPASPATYSVTPAGALTVPSLPQAASGPAPLPVWVWALPAAGAILALLLLLVRRRSDTPPPPDPDLAEVPLRITGLGKKYARGADRWAVRDLSFTVGRGQVLGLLGPNGAGKTTTLRMLLGLVTPDEGGIRVFGHAIRPGAPVLSRVGAFVEGPGFLPHLSGRRNLDLYWKATGRPEADAHREEVLEIAGLGEALDRPVRTYSQGMRQRLALAQAMLGLPDLLLLDEPTNGLDPPQIREMREVMIAYAASGRTVVVSSHLLSEVEQSCTHLVVMDRGRLVAAGPVEEITGGTGAVTIGLAHPVPDPLLAKAAALPGVADLTSDDDRTLLLHLKEGTTTTDLLAPLLSLGLPITTLAPQRRLEDAFLHLIGGPS